MLIAHLPAGYLLCRALLGRRSAANRHRFDLGLLGSFVPDLDLLYLHTLAERTVNHHIYPSHQPWFWLLLCLGGAALARAGQSRAAMLGWLMLLAGAHLHLVLDTVVGGIAWWAPWSLDYVRWAEVPASAQPGRVRYLQHWMAPLEIGICLLAGCIWWHDRCRERGVAPRLLSWPLASPGTRTAHRPRVQTCH